VLIPRLANLLVLIPRLAYLLMLGILFHFIKDIITSSPTLSTKFLFALPNSKIRALSVLLS
jgi:hypothetical protein